MSPNFLSRFDKERLGQRKAAVGEAAAAGRALGSLVVDSSFEFGLFAKLPVGPVCCRVSSSEEQTAAFGGRSACSPLSLWPDLFWDGIAHQKVE